MWILLCLIGVVTFLFWILTSPFYWKGKNVPYLTPVPLFGSYLPIFQLGIGKFNNYLYQKFPGQRFYGMHFFTRPALFIKDPELIQRIMVQDYEYFTSHGIYGNQDRDPFGGNLFLIHGQQWKEMRGKLSPYFSPSRVKTMLSYVYETVDKIQIIIEKNIKNNQPSELKSISMHTTTDVITKALFGIETDSFAEKDSIFNKLAIEMFHPSLTSRIFLSIISPRIYDILKVSLFNNKISHQLIEIIRKAVDYRRKSNIQLQDFLQGMMELVDNRKSNAQENTFFQDETRVPCYDLNSLICQSGLLFGAGIETSAVTMTFFFYETAVHPEIQDKCREEIISVVKETGREITVADLNKLTYLTAALQETLRMHPPLNPITRKCTKDYKIPDSDVTIQKGTFVIAAANGIQMDAKYYPEPEIFRPERFLDSDKIQGGTYLPFGLGPKTCIGMALAYGEMKLVISRLLQRYEFCICSKTNVPLKIKKFNFVKTPAEGLWLDVRPLVSR